MTKLTTIALSVIVAGFIASQTTAIGRPPNIVVIMIDDQSWNGTSVEMIPGNPLSKSDFYQTPRLEQLASQGMVFSNAYSAAPLCSPTRGALLTGRSPAQLHMTDIISAGLQRSVNGFPLTPPEWSEIDRNLHTLPRRVQVANPSYHVGHVGKWHLNPSGVLLGYGYAPNTSYDLSFRFGPEDPGGIFGNTQSAMDFLDARAADDKPFFLDLAYFGVHEPIEARPETLAKYQNLPPGQRHVDPHYAAYTEDLDTGLGMVLDRLDALGMSDNTYVIYTSDNGASRGISSNAPLFSGKNNLWEGGIRVPMVITGPGITPGSVSHVPVTTADIYTTVGALAGNTAPLPVGVEGADLTQLMFNDGVLPAGQAFLGRQYADKGAIFWHSPHYNDPTFSVRSVPSSAVRLGDYKLVLEYGARGLEDKVYLFNLADNLTESNQLSSPLNLAEQLPEKRDEMLGLLQN